MLRTCIDHFKIRDVMDLDSQPSLQTYVDLYKIWGMIRILILDPYCKLALIIAEFGDVTYFLILAITLHWFFPNLGNVIYLHSQSSSQSFTNCCRFLGCYGFAFSILITNKHWSSLSLEKGTNLQSRFYKRTCIDLFRNCFWYEFEFSIIVTNFH